MANSNLWTRTTLLGWGTPTLNYAWTDLPKTIDHANERIGVVFTAREDCSLTHANVPCENVTGTSPYYKVQLWPMSASNGQPDMTGTVLAETADFQGSVTGAWPYTKILQQAFTSPFSAVAGTVYAMVIMYADDGSTIDGSNYCKFEYTGGRENYAAGVGGYIETYSGSATTFYSNGTYHPLITCKTDKTYDLGGTLHCGDASNTMTSAGLRTCNKITMPAAVSGAGLEMYCIGFNIQGAFLDSADEAKVGCWDASGSELCDPTSYDADHGVATGMGDIGHYLGTSTVYFSEPVQMTTGNSYYVGSEAISGYVQTSFKMFDAFQSECERSWPMAGLIEGAYWNGSSWSDSWAGSGAGKSRWLINPIISDLHGTSSGGGGGGSSIPGPSIGVIG